VLSFSQLDFDRLAQIVREETGNQISQKHFPMLESRLQAHASKLGLQSTKDYWDYFEMHERSEREVIVGLMTTHYTFFFREYIHFDKLEEWIELNLRTLKNRYENDKKGLRVLSAGCSKGHEVYSLAMFLDKVLEKKHGIAFQIFGIDIDGVSVQYAQNGVYPLTEVNKIPKIYLADHWKRGTGGVREFAAVRSQLKSKVIFEKLNLFDIATWKMDETFDVIFCRNVFIYFGEDDVKQIANTLASKLTDGGMLVSGVSEPLRFQGWGLSPFGPSCYVNSAIKKKPESAPLLHSSASPAMEESTSFAALTSSKYRVLCVDDSPTIQKIMQKIFAQDSFCEAVEVADNGKVAREKLSAEKFDLVTLDIHMPIMGGIEFLEQYYKKDEDPPVIMVSSVNRTDIDLATKALSLGAFDYVEKPSMNNLYKSGEEIITKASMAMRAKAASIDEHASTFDHSIGKKLVVPDASQCLRVVFASVSSLRELGQVIHGQRHEYRSPPLWVVCPKNDESPVSNVILASTKQPLNVVREGARLLRANQVYVSGTEQLGALLGAQRMKSVSFQFINVVSINWQNFEKKFELQVLLDEKYANSASQLNLPASVAVSDITPAISFASLSLEFFARLRHAKARDAA
jgi:chemotaxis protein methyltransferase CheR